MDLQMLLRIVVQQKAADLFLKVGGRPTLRVDGNLRRLSKLGDEAVGEIDDAFNESVLEEVLDRHDLERFRKTGEGDAAYEVEDLGRFRVNVFRQRGHVGFVFRYIPFKVPSLEDLSLPAAQLRRLCDQRRGLVLVTGIAGSGKSTCLASMIHYINETQSRHIVTIEDPIEFVHHDQRCIIEQREVGFDTEDFVVALRACVRQSPDVILIGEMRDRETVEAAINAAETGHLVLSTLHTVNAVQTVERILGFFPPHLHPLIRLQLSLVLRGALSLRLLPRRDRPGMIPAAEMLISTPTVRDLLEQGKTRELTTALREGEYFGTMTFAQSLAHLARQGCITEEDALAASDNPDELRLELKGIGREKHPGIQTE